MIAITNFSVAQTNPTNYQKQSDINELKSLNSIKEGFFYHLDYPLEKPGSKTELSGFRVVKRFLNGSYIVVCDSMYADSTSINLNLVSLSEVGNSWKKSSNMTKDENSILQGKFWLKIENRQKWNSFDESDTRINAIKEYGGFLQVLINGVRLADLLEKEFITYIEKASISAKSEATVLDLNLHPNRINTIHAYLSQFDGRSELVSIKEPFYDVNNIDLVGRFLSSGRASEFSDSHALEMATIIAGNGSTSLTGLGVAPQVFHTSSSNEEILPDPSEYFNSNEIQVQNHSYGTEIESFYGVAASLYDQQVYQNPQMVHVFSIGNSGLESPDHGVYAGISGFSNLTGNFKQAKNVLTIGAVDTTMNTIQFNSNGPAFDGRIKPELVAYSMTGTSNSAALVSGVSVLLAQSYRQKFSSDIEAALVKAILINSADDIAELGPDHKTGFGSLNAYAAMQTLEKSEFIEGEIQKSQQKFKIKIPDNPENFKATLTWTDPPAQANDAVALVNDLNFAVQQSSGSLHLPWVLSTDPNRNALNNPAVRGIDHLNNIEQIYVDEFDSDSLEILVDVEIPLSTPQSFSLVYDWEVENEFFWTSPTFKDNIPYNGETASHIRWESSFKPGKVGNLYYKLVADENWKLIKENIQLQHENFRWTPIIVNDLAQLKMEIDNQSYVSDTFSISKPLRTNVGFNCTDSLSLFWESVPDRDFYTLFHFKDNEMKAFLSTQDTTVSLIKTDLESTFFKVQAYKNGKPLIQGSVIDYNLQSSNCFLEAYFVEAVQGEGIYHNLKLSSLSGVEKIRFEKKNVAENDWVAIAEFSAANYDIEYLQVDPENGFNYSRAIIYFSNGETITSEIQSSYFVNSSDYIVYPNPIRRELDLKVFAKEGKSDAYIFFYSLRGLEVFSSSIPSDRNFLNLDYLSPGIYFYKIVAASKELANGKILIQP